MRSFAIALICAFVFAQAPALAEAPKPSKPSPTQKPPGAKKPADTKKPGGVASKGMTQTGHARLDEAKAYCGSQAGQLSAALTALRRHPQRWHAFEAPFKAAQEALRRCFEAVGKKNEAGAIAAARQASTQVAKARAIAFRADDLDDSKAGLVRRARACISDLKSMEARLASAPRDVKAGLKSAFRSAMRLLFDTEAVLHECAAASWKANEYMVKAGMRAAHTAGTVLEEKAKEFGPELARCLREIGKVEADAVALGLRGKGLAAKVRGFSPRKLEGALAAAQLTQCHKLQDDLKKEYDGAKAAALAEVRKIIAKGHGPATKVFQWMKAAVYSKVPDGGEPVSVTVPVSGSVKVEGVDVGGGVQIRGELSRKGETFYLTLKPSKSLSLGVSTPEASAKLELKAGHSYTFALSAWRHLWEVAGFLGRAALQSALTTVISAAFGFTVPDVIIADVLHFCHIGLTGEYLSSLKTLQGVGHELCLGVKASVSNRNVGGEIEEGICGSVAVDRSTGKVTVKAELGAAASIEIEEFNKAFGAILKGKLAKVLPESAKFGAEVSVSAELAFDCKAKKLPGSSAGDMLQFIARTCPGALDRPVEASADFSGTAIITKHRFTLSVGASHPNLRARPLLDLLKKRNARAWLRQASAKADWSLSHSSTLLDRSREGDIGVASVEGGITIEGAAKELCEGTIAYSGGRVRFTLGKCQQDKIKLVERLMARR